MPTATLEAVLTYPNLYAAWERVKANQGVGGVDGISLEDFASDLQNQLQTLKKEVEFNTYRPQALLRVYIDKEDGNLRPLSIPTIRDRVLQTAVTIVLTPIFELEFEDISFAYRQGRSINQAIAQVEKYRDEGYRWVVDADINKFFDQVDHEKLLQAISKLIQDQGILKLIKQWLKTTIVDGKQRYQIIRGVPQGSPISPLLSNLYLDHLDDTLLDENLRLVRFADDFLILCKSKEKAQAALELTEETLRQLKLSINSRKTQIVDFDTGFKFLGVKFIRSLTLKASKETTTAQTPGKKPAIDPTALKPIKKTPTKQNKEQTPDYFSFATPEGEQATYPEEMREAFIQAGISAKQFPSEPDQPEPIEPPAIDQPTTEQPENEIFPTEHTDPRLKTLYLMEHGSVLGKEYERFVLRQQGQDPREIPAIHVDQIMVFGNAQITTQAMQFCLQRRIPVYLLSGKGRYYGVIDSFDTDPVLLHREQFIRAEEPAFARHLATQILTGKLANSRLLMKRTARHRNAPAFDQAAQQIHRIITQLPHADTLDQLRGYEGNAARIYFQAIAATVDEQWQFNKRIKNPPTDPINAMLSYGYTLLFYNIYTFLRARGLNPHVGYLHPIRMGHPALASDMIEEFRAIIVDSVVLNLVLNQKITPADFIIDANADIPCKLSNQGRKLFTQHLEKKLNSQLQHPIANIKLSYRGCIEYQINHLAAVIRQQQNTYQPMILR
jgi:CRISPR-associated protein Cas1